MEAEHYREIVSIAKCLATRHGFHEEAEDFAQFAAFKISDGRKAKMYCLFVDFLRSNYGRPDRLSVKGFKFKRSVMRFYKEIDGDCKQMADLNLSAPEKLNFEFYKKHLKSNHRAVLTLRYQFGFTQLEIADAFGITEGRVSQILTEIEGILHDVIAQENGIGSKKKTRRAKSTTSA